MRSTWIQRELFGSPFIRRTCTRLRSSGCSIAMSISRRGPWSSFVTSWSM